MANQGLQLKQVLAAIEEDKEFLEMTPNLWYGKVFALKMSCLMINYLNLEFSRLLISHHILIKFE